MPKLQCDAIQEIDIISYFNVQICEILMITDYNSFKKTILKFYKKKVVFFKLLRIRNLKGLLAINHIKMLQTFKIKYFIG